MFQLQTALGTLFGNPVSRVSNTQRDRKKCQFRLPVRTIRVPGFTDKAHHTDSEFREILHDHFTSKVTLLLLKMAANSLFLNLLRTGKVWLLDPGTKKKGLPCTDGMTTLPGLPGTEKSLALPPHGPMLGTKRRRALADTLGVCRLPLLWWPWPQALGREPRPDCRYRV